MSVEKLKCIKCGKGCKLTVNLEDGKVINVTGNKCSRGPKYAREKLNDPKEDKTSKKEKSSKKEKKVLKEKKSIMGKIKKLLRRYCNIS